MFRSQLAADLRPQAASCNPNSRSNPLPTLPKRAFDRRASSPTISEAASTTLALPTQPPTRTARDVDPSPTPRDPAVIPQIRASAIRRDNFFIRSRMETRFPSPIRRLAPCVLAAALAFATPVIAFETVPDKPYGEKWTDVSPGMADTLPSLDFWKTLDPKIPQKYFYYRPSLYLFVLRHPISKVAEGDSREFRDAVHGAHRAVGAVHDRQHDRVRQRAVRPRELRTVHFPRRVHRMPHLRGDGPRRHLLAPPAAGVRAALPRAGRGARAPRLPGRRPEPQSSRE